MAAGAITVAGVVVEDEDETGAVGIEEDGGLARAGLSFS